MYLFRYHSHTSVKIIEMIVNTANSPTTNETPHISTKKKECLRNVEKKRGKKSYLTNKPHV